MLRAMSSYVYIKKRLHPGLLDGMVRGGAQAIEIFAARGQAVNIIDPDKRMRIDAMDEIKRAIEVAEYAPFRYLIQHIGRSDEYDDPRKFENALSGIEHLRAFARPLGVSLLLENIPNDLSTPEKLKE